MLLATFLLLCPLPQTEAPKAVATLASANAAEPAKDSASQPLLSAPVPKVRTDAEGSSANAQGRNVASDANASAGAGVEAVEPGSPVIPFRPVKPAYTRPRETPRQRVAWYALTFAGSGAAAFDAWSTRQAVSQHYGTESNPFLRPFSHSRAMYVATQASPVLMDYLGKRLMVSPNPWLRRLWWLPQVAGSGFSVTAGVHNLSVIH